MAPSRTAAIGATRVARIAGATLASSVTAMPAARLTITVRVANTVPAFGSCMPIEANIDSSAFARPSPAARPISEASAPITSASSTTEPSTWPREAPSVRSMASSRVRCATVTDSVLKITNAPTNSAIAPNASRT